MSATTVRSARADSVRRWDAGHLRLFMESLRRASTVFLPTRWSVSFVVRAPRSDAGVATPTQVDSSGSGNISFCHPAQLEWIDVAHVRRARTHMFTLTWLGIRYSWR